MGKISSTSQKISKLVFTSRNWHLQISKTSAKFGIKKKNCFHETGNPFSLAGMKNSLKNTFPLGGETVLTARNIWIMEETIH